MIVRAVFAAAVLINLLSHFTYAKRGFLFSLPSVLQRDTTEQGCITFQDLPYIRVRVELRQEGEVKLVQADTRQDSGCIELPITVPDGEYELVVTGETNDYSYSDNATVRVEASKPVVFIQTDKPIYKPGQPVKFRVLVVGADLKPRMDPISEMFIEDPNGVRMMQWLDTDVTNFKGIADLEMPLSREPVQGAWKVSVRPEPEGSIETASFKVEEYVLPKYEISIKTPSKVIINAREVAGDVCAMYTYGEPVRGLLTLEICYKRDYYHWQRPSRESSYCLMDIVPITGCHSFSHDVTGLHIDDNIWGNSNGHVTFSAKVQENATRVTLNTSATAAVTREMFTLSFSKSSDAFKPGLPYHGKVMVTQFDGAPGVNETVEIVLTNYRNNQEFRKRFQSNNQGEVLFSLPPITGPGTASLSVKALMPLHVYDYSEVKLFPYAPNVWHNIRRWFSPTQSFLQIEPFEEVATCDQSVSLNITHTVESAPTVTLFYQLMSNGNLLKAGKQTHSYGNSRKRIYSSDGSFEEGSLYDCPEGQEWRSCGSPCVATCDDPLPICTRECMPRCQCVHPNTLLHNGTCLSPDRCPPPDGSPAAVCDGGKVWTKCARPCTPTCDVPHPICSDTCVERCECPGNMLWHNGACVTEASCPGYVPPASEERFVVSLPLTVAVEAAMSPGVKLVVYYVREDGETVADSKSITVAECTTNQVELQFEEPTLYPGDEATLTLHAAPDSICSIGAVDKSVSLLGGNNALTVSRVLSKLAELDLTESSIPGRDTYCEDQLADQPRDIVGPPAGRPIGRQKRSIVPWPGMFYSDYYDSMHAFRRVGSVALGDLLLESRPCSVRSGRVAYSGLPMAIGRERVVFAAGSAVERRNFEGVIKADDANPKPKQKKSLDVRTYFPETWLWNLHSVGQSGSLILKETLPHTVTEWVANSFCTNEDQGIGVSQSTAIKGFQPFFLSLTLPVSVVRGEVLKLPVTVFNYLSDCLVVAVSIEPSPQYEVVGEESSEQCVCGQEAATAYFNLRFTEIGQINIGVQAESVENNGICGNTLFMSDQIGVRDAVERPLLVEAEGREVEKTESAYVCPEGKKVSQNIEIVLPENYVEDTPRATVSVIGDIMGPTLSGLDSLVRLPMGCGEQNMILFAPNIYVLHYLEGINQVTMDIKTKALEFMQTGYQRELTYRHDDGSYSAFGKSDDSGSTWLTAYVVKSFAQAKKYIFIDTKDLQKSILWLMTQQTPDGDFVKVGNVIHKDMKGGVDGGASLTTFVLVALLESKPHIDIPGVDTSINKAFEYIESLQMGNNSSRTYTMTLLAYAYALSGRDSAGRLQMMAELEKRAVEEDGLKHWTRAAVAVPTADEDGWDVSPIHPPSTLDVEMTAYMLMATVGRDGSAAVINGVPLVKWLSTQRNAQGGFASTQDTVVALQALSQYASLVSQSGSDLTVTVNSDAGQAKIFRVTDDNRLVLQREDFTVPTRLSFDVEGTGCALVQTMRKYNVANISRAQPSFSLSVDVYRHDNCKVRIMRVCASYEATDGASSMSVIEVTMVSGWIPDKTSIKDLMKLGVRKLKKYEVDMNKVNFYFDELTDSSTCFRFLVEQLVEVDGAKPSKAEVYDYYETTDEMRVSEAYEIKPVCGTKQELPFTEPDDWDEMDPSRIEQRRLRHPHKPPTKEDLAHISREEFEENNRREPEDIEQMRQPDPVHNPTKEDLPVVTREEYDANNRRDPGSVEQMRQPDPVHNPTKEDLPVVTREEYDANNRRDPENVEQMRQPDPVHNPTKEDLPVVMREEYDANNRRDPENVEQMRQPDPVHNPTKEDLPVVTREEYDANNRRDPENVEQMRQPDPVHNPTKEDLPVVTREEYDANNRRDPENVEQQRQPVEFPGRPGNKEDLPDLTDREYEAINNRDPEDIEQARKPDTLDPDDIRDLINEDKRQPVDEPLIVPEVLVPLGNEELCPVCSDSIPDNIEDKMCQYEHAYKMAFKKPGDTYPLRVLTAYLQEGELPVRLARLAVPENCECGALTHIANKKILILNPEGSGIEPGVRSNRGSLTLGGGSQVYKMPKGRSQLQRMDRKLKSVVCGG